MADIFLSYKKEDRALVQRVATSLSAKGYTIWWDDRLIPTERWEPTIYSQLASARLVIVLWTKNSVLSDWVREEASRAARKKKLLSVRFDECELPAEFQSFQYYSVLGWNPSMPSADWQSVQQKIADRLNVPVSFFSRVWPRRQVHDVRHWPDGTLRAADLPTTPVPGTVFQDLMWSPPMTVAPTGKYWMGSLPAEEGRYPDAREDPRHEVQINHVFAASQSAITIADFKRFTSETGHRCTDPVVFWDGSRWSETSDKQFDSPGWRISDDHPATLLSWYDAKAYCKWLSVETGRPYRLLTESEWEYICRCGTYSPFCFGSSITTSQANFNGDPVYASGGTFGGSLPGLNREMTIPVREIGQNEWGFFQLHGNVWEWVEDEYGPYSACPTGGAAAHHDGATCRCVRGGSWSDPPRHLRSAVRGWQYPNLRANSIGFRIATTLADAL